MAGLAISPDGCDRGVTTATCIVADLQAQWRVTCCYPQRCCVPSSTLNLCHACFRSDDETAGSDDPSPDTGDASLREVVSAGTREQDPQLFQLSSCHASHDTERVAHSPHLQRTVSAQCLCAQQSIASLSQGDFSFTSAAMINFA
jgi:hypothetical protein